MTALLPSERLHRRARRVVGAEIVDVHDALHFVRRNLLDRAIDAVAGVAEHRIEAAEARDGLLDEGAHDVGFVDRGDFLAAVASSVLEGELRDARRCLFSDDLQALDDARHHFVFEASVEILGVLPDDHEIDAVEPRRGTGQVRHRPQVRVEIERLAQPDVHAGEPLRDRRGDRPLQRDPGPADRSEQFRRKRAAGALEGDHAGVMAVPVDRHARRFEHAQHRLGHLRADAVARNQRDRVGHARQL